MFSSTGECLVGQSLCSVYMYSRHSLSLMCASDTLCTLGDVDPCVCDTTRLHNRLLLRAGGSGPAGPALAGPLFRRVNKIHNCY